MVMVSMLHAHIDALCLISMEKQVCGSADTAQIHTLITPISSVSN